MKSSFLFIGLLLGLLLSGCEESGDSLTQPQELSLPTAGNTTANRSTSTVATMPEVDTITEVGIVGQPASVNLRDAGFSTMLDGRILWTFGDTFLNVTSEDGENYRSNTAAIANLSDPLNVREPLDANGVPYPALRFTAAEQAFNDSTGSATDRIALWIGGLVPKQNDALAFYIKYHVTGPLTYGFQGVGVALFRRGRTFASRSPKMLFNPGEPRFVKAALHEGYVYLYGSLPDGGFSLPHGVARVPLRYAKRRSAYRFWNGSNWVRDVNQTATVFTNVSSGLTISYNAHLGRFIAIYSPPFSNDILIRTADHMQGPWSDPSVLLTGEPPASSFVRQGMEHVELAKNDGKTIYVSYFRLTGYLQGEIRLVEVTFK